MMKWLTGIVLAIAALAGTAAAVESYDPMLDTNHDWKIDLEDLATIGRYWLQECSGPGWCEGADFDYSGTVDLGDMQNLAGAWLTHAPVVINEIMYNPAPDNTGDEYLELYNRSDEPVDLSGWTVSVAFDFTFATGTILPADGYLVVCRDKSAAEDEYGITNTVGSYATQNLSNAGERIVLKDADGVIIDDVTYSDGSHPVGSDPWPTEADGGGNSLELISPTLDNNLAANWGIGLSYSPGVENSPQSGNSGDIVINEIMYKPQRQQLTEKFDAANATTYYEQGDDELGEYVELYNRGAAPVNLNGWRFTDGIDYTFDPNDRYLYPGGYLVVAAYPTVLAQRYGLPTDAVTGPFTLQLNDGGERLTLCDASGAVMDTVRYNDRMPWPVGPDEYGNAIECINPISDNDTPANWRSSQTELSSARIVYEWQYVTVTGQATSDRIYIYANGAGEWLIDTIQISGIPDSAVNGNFETNDAGWTKSGNHSGTYRTTQTAHDGNACEHIVATGVGGSSSNSLNRTISGISVGQTYTVSCWVAYLSGHNTLTIQFSGSGVEETPSADLADDMSIVSNPNGQWMYHGYLDSPYTNSVSGSLGGIVNGEVPDTGIGWYNPSTNWVMLIKFTVDSSGSDKTNFVAGDVGGHATTGATWTADADGTYLINYLGYNARDQFKASGGEIGRTTTLVLRVDGSVLASTPITGGGGYDGSANAYTNSVTVPLLAGQTVDVTQEGGDWVGIGMTIYQANGIYTTITAQPGAAAEDLVGKGTPGMANSVLSSNVPPLVDNLEHSPLKPTSSNAVTITVRVVDDGSVNSVICDRFLNLQTSSTPYTMYDNGTNGDAVAADGIYTTTLPAQPSQTLVHYRIRATDNNGATTTYPYPDDPSPTQAYYHYNNEFEGSDNYDTLHLFITQENINLLGTLANAHSEEYADCTLVINHIAYPHIKARFKGRWAPATPPYSWKFKFNRNQLFEGNSVIETADSVPVTQKVVFDCFRQIGIEGLDAQLAHMYLNNGSGSSYWADYCVNEYPNQSWSEKYSYTEGTEVYKCRSVESASPRRNSDLFFFGDLGNETADNGLQTDYNYWGAYSKKFNPLQPPDEIRDLVYNLNMLTGDALLAWVDANIDVEQCFKSWAMHNYFVIDDYPGHNYYMFKPVGPTDSKWRILNYDFDSFGRFGTLRLFYGDGYGDSPDWQRNKLYRCAYDNLTLRRIYLLIMRDLLTNYRFDTDPDVPSYMRSVIANERLTLLGQLGQPYQEPYNLPLDSDTPVVSPTGGKFVDPTAVIMTSQPGWKIYYTTDGSDPRLSGTRQLYSSVIVLTNSAVISAAAHYGTNLPDGNWTKMVRYEFQFGKEVLVNEVLAHSHVDAPDWIELYNPTQDAINIGGWFLSDDNDNLTKYQIAAGTSISPNGYIVFYQDQHFGNLSDPGSSTPFALSENGEKVYLSEDIAGVITIVDSQKFEASETDVSLGRYVKSTGGEDFVALTSKTPGAANASLVIGPIVISQFVYNPQTANQDEEYIELRNISGNSVTLYDFIVNLPWKFTDGIDYTFPTSPVTIGAGGYLIVAKNPTAFTARYGTLPGGGVVLGPYDGNFNNDGERVELAKPGDTDNPGLYYIRVDSVRYSSGFDHDSLIDRDPWPVDACRRGKALKRKVLADYGNDVANWQATAPAPGTL